MPKLVPLCPTCLKTNGRNKLILRQINLDSAVYMCDIPTCAYPDGFDWLVEKRSLKEWIQEKRKREKKKRKRKLKMEKNIKAICKENLDVSDILNELNNIPQEPLNLDNLLEDEIRKMNDTNTSLPGLDEYLNCDADESTNDIINNLDDILGTIPKNEVKVVKEGNKVKILEMVTFLKSEVDESKLSIVNTEGFNGDVNKLEALSLCDDFNNFKIPDFGDLE